MNTISRILFIILLLAGKSAIADRDDAVSWIMDKKGCKVANTFPRPGETISWSGECKSGYAEGDGVLQWYFHGKEDDRYEGKLEQGWANGRGILYKANGGKYEGDWKDSTQHGEGRYEDPDGSWYEGEWKDGKPNGKGQYRRPDGKLFVGEFVDGIFEGDLEPEKDDGNPNKI